MNKTPKPLSLLGVIAGLLLVGAVASAQQQPTDMSACADIQNRILNYEASASAAQNRLPQDNVAYQEAKNTYEGLRDNYQLVEAACQQEGPVAGESNCENAATDKAEMDQAQEKELEAQNQLKNDSRIPSDMAQDLFGLNVQYASCVANPARYAQEQNAEASHQSQQALMMDYQYEKTQNPGITPNSFYTYEQITRSAPALQTGAPSQSIDTACSRAGITGYWVDIGNGLQRCEQGPQPLAGPTAQVPNYIDPSSGWPNITNPAPTSKVSLGNDILAWVPDDPGDSRNAIYKTGIMFSTAFENQGSWTVWVPFNDCQKPLIMQGPTLQISSSQLATIEKLCEAGVQPSGASN